MGDECADAKQKCHKVDNKKLFFSCSGPTDGWGCADHPCKSDPFDIENEYLGKKAQPVYPAPAKPSAACKAAHGVFAKAAAAAGAKKQDNMYTAAACAPMKDAAGFAKVKAAMEGWLDMMAKCPKFCAPGTVMYTSDGVQDDDGVCLNADTLADAKMELAKITKDTCMGTNCKIKADFPTQGKTLCARATAATAGFYSAVNEARKENIAHPPCGKCYGECTGAKGVADAKACKYEFYAKGMFAKKKCTCADDHVAGFHQELMQSPKSIKHAEDKAAENKKAEAAASAEEAKQTKLEAKETAEAKKLAGVEASEKKKYEDDLHKEEKEAAAEAEHAAQAGAKADADRVAADKKYIAAANAKAAATKKAAAAAAAKAKKDAAAHDKKLGAIDATYGKTMKALTAKKAKAEAAFSAEGAKITATFNKAVKGNNAAYAAKKKQLAAEKASNAKTAAADQAKIKADYAKKVAAHNKAEAAYQKVQAAAAAVLKAKRDKDIAAAKAKAKKADDT